MMGLIKGRQRIGKTTWLVGIALWLCWFGGYSPKEIVSNFHLYNEDGSKLIGYHYLDNHAMRQFVGEMINRKARHLIVLIDEIDRVFSHRNWSNKEQLESLIGLWQDEKAFLQIWGTAHIGLSVDSLIREISQVEIMVVKKDIQADCLHGIVINQLNKQVFRQEMHRMSLVQKCFDTRELVV